jgi:hypothetical protein
MVGAGNKIVQENEVEDPAGYIARALSDDFSTKHGVTVNVDGQVAAVGENVAELSRQYAGHDYLLDVKTFDWGFQYFPTDWNSYRCSTRPS